MGYSLTLDHLRVNSNVGAEILRIEVRTNLQTSGAAQGREDHFYLDVSAGPSRPAGAALCSGSI